MHPEDDKLVTLARSALARSRGAHGGAAVRDDIGRTYSAAAVHVGSLSLTALELAAAMAVSSGVQRLEAAVLIGAGDRLTGREAEVLAVLGNPAVTVLADEPQ
ncbi:MAG TPA: cytidine deaminase [Mycobacteriales bacterium]|nr:cytidine deaminase [Mycobacteriales bacterium]